MAAITASMVAELRAKTDAPMMECKKALTEADGDMARAEELLRVKLGNKASKAASRVTAEGVVASFIGGNAVQAAGPGGWVEVSTRYSVQSTPAACCIIEVTDSGPGLPAPVADMVLTMLAKQPEERPQSARWVADRARQLRSALPSSTGPDAQLDPELNQALGLSP